MTMLCRSSRSACNSDSPLEQRNDAATDTTSALPEPAQDVTKNNEGRASRTAAAAYRAATALLDARCKRGNAGIDDGAKSSNSIGKGRGGRREGVETNAHMIAFGVQHGRRCGRHNTI